MEYVIDASVAVKWLLPEPHSDKADALLQTFRRQELRLIAPELILAEVGSTLWKRSVATGEISVQQTEECYTDFLELRISLQASRPLAERAFRLAVAERLTVYDALYVVLALERGCELITADQALVNKLGNKLPQVRRLASLQLF